MFFQIAIDTPLRRVFDYLPPIQENGETAKPPPLGVRVRVPFGRQRLVTATDRALELVAVAALAASDKLADDIVAFDVSIFDADSISRKDGQLHFHNRGLQNERSPVD